MRHYPEDKWDREEVERFQPDPWMLEVLKVNPPYCSWGPHEDYMWKRGRDEGPDELGRAQDHGWESRVLLERWADFDWSLDDYNECVNFYFEIGRDAKACPTCCGKGIHPDAQWVTESFYSHSSPFKAKTARELQSERILVGFGAGWDTNSHGWNAYPDDETLNKYGDDFHTFCEQMRGGGGWGDQPLHKSETAALLEAGRQTDESFGHDAINRSIICRARCERFGLPYTCPECDGHGDTFIEPHCHLSLILWILHPRKGASRGIEIKRVEQSELPAVFALLRAAADRNAERFSTIPPPDPS